MQRILRGKFYWQPEYKSLLVREKHSNRFHVSKYYLLTTLVCIWEAFYNIFIRGCYVTYSWVAYFDIFTIFLCHIKMLNKIQIDNNDKCEFKKKLLLH